MLLLPPLRKSIEKDFSKDKECIGAWNFEQDMITIQQITKRGTRCPFLLAYFLQKIHPFSFHIGYYHKIDENGKSTLTKKIYYVIINRK
jgi:hypothetical protein